MKISSIVFATGNQDKLDEARKILGVDIEGTGLEIEEIQSLDPKKVATVKAQRYFEELQKPIFVEDVALSFDSLNGLPGTYINDFLKVLDNKGLVDLLKERNNRGALAITTIVYKDGQNEDHVFQGEMKGTISEAVRGENGFGWDKIFIPDGDTKTLGEMSLDEKNKYSMRAKALKKFANWLSSKK